VTIGTILLNVIDIPRDRVLCTLTIIVRIDGAVSDTMMDHRAGLLRAPATPMATFYNRRREMTIWRPNRVTSRWRIWRDTSWLSGRFSVPVSGRRMRSSPPSSAAR
jgi:hypothetical protein